MNIKISVPATAFRKDSKTPDQQLFASIDGLSSDELFGDYLLDHNNPHLSGLRIRDGSLRFEFNQTSHELWATIIYEVERKLSSDEEDALVKYTLGQLSDGIGENLTQDYVRNTGVVINPTADPAKAKVHYL